MTEGNFPGTEQTYCISTDCFLNIIHTCLRSLQEKCICFHYRQGSRHYRNAEEGPRIVHGYLQKR